jgi:hypothetical protein
LTAVASGTCLTQTAIFIGEDSIHAAADRDAVTGDTADVPRRRLGARFRATLRVRTSRDFSSETSS